MDFTGKSVLVTGAIKGIGRKTAEVFASEGATVIINYRDRNDNKEKAEAFKKELEEKNVQVLLVSGDVSKEEDVKDIFNTIKKEIGHLDILVNNAGITRDNLILRMKPEDFDDVIDANLRSAFLCMKYASKLMMKQKSGHIISLSSVVGVSGNSGQVNYAASKAGIIGMTKSLAKEVGSRNITVNAVAPGFIKTDMTKKLDPSIIEAMEERIPLSYLGETEDIANTILFLASDKARYITGQVINVDGGMVM